MVKITEARFEAQLADMLDVSQARTVLFSTESSVPQLESQIRVLVNSISVLVGRYPGELNELLESDGRMPEYRQMVSAGVPSDLLRRRPDIVEAELQLAVYAANIGISKKRFPSYAFSQRQHRNIVTFSRRAFREPQSLLFCGAAIVVDSV